MKIPKSHFNDFIKEANAQICDIYNRGGNSDEMFAKWCEMTRDFFPDKRRKALLPQTNRI